MKQYIRAFLYALFSVIPSALVATVVLGVAQLGLSGSSLHEKWLAPELVRNSTYGIHMSGYDLILLLIVFATALFIFVKNIRSKNNTA